MRREKIAPRPDWQRKVEQVGLEFHTQELEVLGEGKWRTQPLGAAASA